MTEPKTGTFHDAATGQTIVRELTSEESETIPQEETPTEETVPE